MLHAGSELSSSFAIGYIFFNRFLELNGLIFHKQAFEWSKKYGPVITVRAGKTFIYYFPSYKASNINVLSQFI
jgi:hypothetical protein